MRSGTLLRIGVSDARGEHLPPGPGTASAPGGDAEHGRGLLIVEAYADRWGVPPGCPPRKAVWAELDLLP
ncbi:ATP-binding protein [Streptomyces sp. NBC_00344]|uniref:ATP-binding protein n=1 Tax=Streptomyces sp. NBC_00344 TaxID=2975720 RepID=UPI003FA779FD